MKKGKYHTQGYGELSQAMGTAAFHLSEAGGYDCSVIATLAKVWAGAVKSPEEFVRDMTTCFAQGGEITHARAVATATAALLTDCRHYATEARAMGEALAQARQQRLAREAERLARKK